MVAYASPRILGPDGNPARLSEADWASALLPTWDAIYRQAFRLAPYNPDVFINEKGFDTLDEQLHISCVASALNTVRNAVLYKGLCVEAFVEKGTESPSPQAQEIADALEYTLNEIEDAAGNPTDPATVVWELLYAIHVGFSVAEIVWRTFEDGPYRGKWGVAEFAVKPAKQIGFDLDTHTLKVVNLTSYTPAGGYQFDIPVEKCLRYTSNPNKGLPHGSPVGRSIYKQTWSLDFLQKFWNLALEKFGVPFFMVNAPKNQMADARKVASQIRQGAAPVFPTGVEAELMQIANGQLGFSEAVQWHEQQIKIAYLHNTLTSGEGKRVGSMALGQVHQDTQEYELARRRRDVEAVLNRQFVRRWVLYNYGADALSYAPKVTLGNWDEVDMQQWAGAVKSLVDAEAVDPQESWIRSRASLPPLAPEHKTRLDQRHEEQQKPPPEIVPAKKSNAHD